MSVAAKLPATIATRYLPVRIIGRGGMGVVYEVVHARTGEHLALKVLQFSAGASLETLERFKREARASAQIKSENVVRVSDADVAPELDGAPFLVMELLEGMDLEQAASLSKPDPATVVGWLRQIAPALDKAHRLGIIHRDLKPENLFLANVEDRPPMVKILDFGIAKMTEGGTAATVSGQVLGTPRYMAPEQTARHPGVTAATDRYALGLVAYRLLVGESYYRGDLMSILAQILHGAQIAPSAHDPSLSQAFDAWFMKACHREPERRFASASQQIEALADALGLPSASSDAPLERSSSPPLRADAEVILPATTISHRSLLRGANVRLTFAAGALLLAAGAAALWYGQSRARRGEASSAAQTPGTAETHPGVSPEDLGKAVTPPPASQPLAPSSEAASMAPPERTVTTAAANSTPATLKPRSPMAPKAPAAPVAPTAEAPSPDPFKDQK